MQNYLANLRKRIQKPLRIRIGGNSMDAATYIPTQSNMITLTDPNAYFNDIPVDFGPSLFSVLNGMSDRVGEMQFIVGVSMQDPQDDIANMVQIAEVAESALGDRLDAIILGNVSTS